MPNTLKWVVCPLTVPEPASTSLPIVTRARPVASSQTRRRFWGSTAPSSSGS